VIVLVADHVPGEATGTLVAGRENASQGGRQELNLLVHSTNPSGLGTGISLKGVCMTSQDCSQTLLATILP